MRKLALFGSLLFTSITGWSFETVQVINSTGNPVNVTGTVGISSSTPINLSSATINVGTVTVGNFPATQNVNIVNVPTTTVSGNVSVQPVSGSTWVITGSTVNISNLPAITTVTFNGASQPVNTTSISSVTIVDPQGSSVSIKQLGVQVVTTDNGIVTNTVIHGLTTGGGGGYVDVKVNPSGALSVDGSGVTQPVSLTNISTVTFAGTSQPVNSTNVNTSTITFNGISQPTNSTVVNTATITFNNVSQPVNSTAINVATVTFNSVSQPVNNTNLNTSTITFNGVSQPVISTSAVAYASATVNTVGMAPGFNFRTQTTTGTAREDLTTWGNGTTLSTTNPIPTHDTGTVTVGTHAVTQGTTPWSVVGGTMSVLIFGSSNTVQSTSINTTTVTFNNTAQPVNSTAVNTSTVTFNNVSQPVNATSVNVATVTISGTPTVNAQQVAGTRWDVSFSTRQTTGVLSSTYNVVSVAISTAVVGVASQTVRVFRLIITVDANTTINFRNGSTNFGDQYPMLANGAITLDLTNEPWYITTSSNGFVIKQSGTANISYAIWYTQS